MALPGERTRNGETGEGDGERFTETQAKGLGILREEKEPWVGLRTAFTSTHGTLRGGKGGRSKSPEVTSRHLFFF